MNDEFRIRPATPSDVPTIVSGDRAIWGEWANSAPLYRQLIDFNPELTLVAETAKGEFAGCVVGLVRTKPLLGWVLSVDIAKEYRGRGLGSLFLRELLTSFSTLAVKRVAAIIDKDNIASQRLFSSFGFTLMATEKDYFSPGNDQGRWEWSAVD